jgi:hypothetical protein
LIVSTDIVSGRSAAPKNGVAGYYIFMAVAIFLLYFLNNISVNQIQPIDPSLTSYYSSWIVDISDKIAAMRIPYLTRYFISCLWAVNLFLGFCIMGNFMLLLYRPRWFHHLVMLVISALAMLAVYVIYRVFPFDINTGGAQTLARVILWMLMSAAGVVLVLKLVQVLKALSERQPPQPPAELAVSILSPGQTDGALSPQPPVVAESPDQPASPALSPEIPVQTLPLEQPLGEPQTEKSVSPSDLPVSALPSEPPPVEPQREQSVPPQTPPTPPQI